jgi:TRAP-type C4-dicarboxylate transport system permease small subunit
MNLTRIVAWLAKALAVLGGAVLVAITALTVASIIGRSVVTVAYSQTPAYLSALDFALGWLRAGARVLASHGVGPVPGDYEMVQDGTGFAIFAFLPWCQLNKGHATVDVFTSFLPNWTNRWIDLVSELLMTIVIVLIAWRLGVGAMVKMRYGETTFILQYPVWWGYAFAMIGAVVAVIVSVYMLAVRVGEVATGRSAFGTPSQGGMH